MNRIFKTYQFKSILILFILSITFSMEQDE